MREIIKSKYARFFIAGLTLNVICAWFSKGFYQTDEHFQILEFCNYKLGGLSATQLPWEFGAKIRASLLPGIAYVLARLMQLCHFYNPFILAFLLRLLTGFATWFIVCKFCLLLQLKFKTPQAEKIFVLMSLLLWFIPFLSVRFSSENVSGIIFLYGLYLILRGFEKPYKPYRTYLFAGLLLGVSFFIRFQMVFAIAGLMAWLIWVKKTEWKFLLILTAGGFAAIGLNMLPDYWFYDGFVFTPYNYFKVNIINNAAAGFGVNPWWFYFPEFIMKAAPPLSVILLFMFFTGIIKNYKKDLFVWIIVPFFMLHCFTAHKELRFMFPVLFICIYCIAQGFDYFFGKNYYSKNHKYVYAFALIINIPLLIYQTLVPAQVSVCYSQFLYENVPKKGQTLVLLNRDYDMAIYGVCKGIYKKPELTIVPLDSVSQIAGYLNSHQLNSALFMSKEKIALNDNLSGYKADVVYCFFPSWISNFNINNWEERSTFWRIYRFSKTD